MKYKVCTYTNRDTYLDRLNKSYSKFYKGEIFILKQNENVYNNFYELISLIKTMYSDYDYILVVDDDIEFLNDTTINDTINFMEKNNISLAGAYMTFEDSYSSDVKAVLDVGWIWGYYMMFKFEDLPDIENLYRRESKFMNCETIDLNKVAHQDIDFSFRFLEAGKKIGVAPVVVKHLPHYNQRKKEKINDPVRLKLIAKENAVEFYKANKLYFNSEKIDIYFLENGELDLDATLGRYFLKKQFKDYEKYIKLKQLDFKSLYI